MADESASFEIIFEDSASDEIKATVDSINRMKQSLQVSEEALQRAQAATQELSASVVALGNDLEFEQAILQELVSDRNALIKSNDTTSASYKQLEKDIETTQKNIKAATDKLRGSQDRLGASQQKVIGLEGKIADQRGKITDATDKLRNGADKASKGGIEGFKDLLDAAKKTGGPLGQLGDRGGDLIEVFQKSGGLSTAIKLGAVAAVAALVAIVTIAAIALTKFAFSAAVAARNNLLAVRAVTENAEAAKELNDVITETAKNTSLSRDAVQNYAISLAKAEVSGDALKESLEAIGTAATVMGDSAGKALETIIKKSQSLGKLNVSADALKETGLEMEDVYGALAKNMKISINQAKAAVQSGSVELVDGVKALNTAVKDKFGELADAKLLDPSVMFSKFGEALSNLFSDVNVEPLLEALKTILSLFDDSTSAGAALKDVMTTAFTALFGAVAEGAPTVRDFFRYMILYSLKTLNAISPVVDWIKRLSAAFDTSGMLDFSIVAKAAFGAIIGIVVMLASAFALLTLPLLAVIKVGTIMWAFILKAFNSIVEYLGSLSLVQAGIDLVKGFANGIKDAAIWVLKAVEGLGQTVIGGIKSLLKIKSPSKVFEEIGAFTAEGMSIGIQQGTPEVEASAQSMVDPEALVPTTAEMEGNGSGNKKVIHIENINYAGPMENFEDFKVKMRMFFQEMALNDGIDVEATV